MNDRLKIDGTQTPRLMNVYVPIISFYEWLVQNKHRSTCLGKNKRTKHLMKAYLAHTLILASAFI